MLIKLRAKDKAIQCPHTVLTPREISAVYSIPDCLPRAMIVGEESDRGA